MARVGITEAAARLGLSVDSVRRRVRTGSLPAQRDNKGVWQVEVPDDVVPMQRQPSAMVAPPYAMPMQPPESHDRADELIGVLRAQLGKAEARAEAAEAERARLFELFISREGQAAAITAKAEAAERRADKAEALLAGELVQLRATVAALWAQERTRTTDLPPAPESSRATRPRRRGLLSKLFG